MAITRFATMPVAIACGMTLWSACRTASTSPKASELIDRRPPNVAPSTNALVPDTEMLVRLRTNKVSRVLGSATPIDTLRNGRIYGDSSIFARITSMVDVGNFLVVGDSRTSPHIFVFDRSSGKVVRTFGREGQGPGEIIYPSNILIDEKSPNNVWVYDFSLRRMLGFDVLADRKSNKTLTMSLPAGGSLLTPMLRGGRVISNGLFQDYSLILLDTAGKPMGKSDLKLPFSSPEVASRMARRLLNVSSMTFAPAARSRIAVAYQFKSEIDVLDLVTGVQTKIVGPRPVKASYEYGNNNSFNWNADNQQAYLAVTADEDRIYALFSGKKDNDKNGPAPTIQVFNWSGDFLSEIAVDKEVSSIAVSASGKEIYAAVNDPWPAVALYKFSPKLTQSWRSRP